MNSSLYPKVRFKELLIEPVRNGIYKQKEYHGRGCKIINMGELFGHTRLFDVPMKRVELNNNEITKSLVKSGDLLFARRSLVAEGAGKCSIVKIINEPTTFESSIIRARPNPRLASSDYLYYYFKSPLGRELMRTILRQVAVSGITGSDLMELEVECPDLDVQHRIAKFLTHLDDRIDLLRETKITLEAIAQTLFKSWFVDFDPVRAKAEGRKPEGIDAETAALFPDGFEESKLGMVPKGWLICQISEVADVIKGKSYSSKDFASQSSTALVTLKSFARGGGFRLDGFKPYAGSYKSSQIVAPGDLIVAYTDVTQAAELIGKPAIVVGLDEFETLVASLDIGIIKPNAESVTRQFLYGLFKTNVFQSHTLAHTSGTTVLHLSKDAIGSFEFACPNSKIIKAFTTIAEAIISRIQINIDQMRTLTNLRDTLLPRLISGQLQIPKDVEAMELAK